MSLLRHVSQLYKRINYNNSNCLNECLYKNIRCSLSSTPKKIKIKKKKSKLNENENENENENKNENESQHGSNRSDWWRMKFYKFRRMSMILGIPFMISTGLYILHDSDIPYVYCLKKLRNYELPIEYDIDSPPNPAPTWCQTIPMIWAAQIHSHRPTRIMKQWNNFMPLLDSKYPIETRMVGIGCLMGMLSGDTNTLPPSVFFDKCLRKLEILKGYKSSSEDGNWTTSRFLNMIYGLCGETQPRNQQLLFAGLQLLLDLTSIPISHGTYDTDDAVKFIIDNCKDIATMKDRDDLASSLMVIYQDPIYIIDFIHKNPPKQKQSSINPNFMEIKKILIDNDCLKFAFNLLDAKSIQLKQLAMFILIGLVGNYPNINEIKTNLGDTDDEKLQNGIKLVDSLAGIGQEHFQRGDNEAAFGAFTEALKYLPRSAQLRYFAGKCLGELGRIEEAKLEYRKAMAITQKTSGGNRNAIPMPEATMQLCNLLIKHTHSIDDLEEATEYLQLLIGDGNGNGIYQIYQTVEHIEIDSIYDRLNICLEKLGRYDDALDKMLNLCKIKPNSHQIHFETGRMAIMCKEYDLAKEHLEFAVNLEPFDMFAKYYLSLSYFHLNNMEKSKKQILQILQSKPNDEKCLNLLAKIHIQQNNLNDALKIYKSLLENQTKGKNNPYLQYQIGVVYENMNQNNQSLQCFQNTANIWLNYVNKIGYEQYFYNRPKEIKALQKIQSRCEIHSHDKEWSNLNNIIQQIGLS